MKTHWWRLALRRLDWMMVMVMVLLMGIGIAFVFSAGYRGGDESAATRLYQKQMVWAVIGLTFFIGFALTDYHRWTQISWGLFLIGLILLVLVFVPQIGVKIYGARRWLQIAGFRFIQPAELMKLAVILLLARIFGRPGRNLQRLRYILLGLIVVGLPMVLILKQIGRAHV